MNDPIAIAVLVGAPARLVLLHEPVGDRVRLAGEAFVDVGLGEWVGFYDWLRAANGDMLGVRSWLGDTDTSMFRLTLRTYESIDVIGAQVRIWFGQNRAFATELSDDQELDIHRIFRNEANQLALVYGVSSLSANEIRQLRSYADPLGTS